MTYSITFSPTGGTRKAAEALCPSGARAISPAMHFMVKTMLKGPCKERKTLELFI